MVFAGLTHELWPAARLSGNWQSAGAIGCRGRMISSSRRPAGVISMAAGRIARESSPQHHFHCIPLARAGSETDEGWRQHAPPKRRGCRDTPHGGRVIGSKVARPFMQAATGKKMQKGNANHKGKG